MKKFNLEEYLRLKKEGKEPKIVTRDGKSVRILCTDFKAVGKEVIAALVMELDKCETMHSYFKNGKYRTYADSSYDLFFADSEPTYRPYKDAEECFRDVLKHRGWVKDKYAIRYVSQITFKEPQGLIDDQVQIHGCNGRTYKEFLQDFIYADDGSPCGVKEG